MRLFALVLVAAGCSDPTPLAELRNASVGVTLWDCSGPNVPVDCGDGTTMRIAIGADGIGSRFMPPCVTLDAEASVDDQPISGGALGGEFEGQCEGVFFLERWAMQPAALPTSHIEIADDSASFELDIAQLFAPRGIEIVSPAGDVHAGDHVEVEFVLPTVADTIEMNTAFVCDGYCPSYLQFTRVERRLSFEVPATATGPINLGAHVQMAVERCAGPASCTATTSLSISIPLR
jgi:hypothetical protein